MDNDGTANNMTIDAQKDGQLRALRAAVSKNVIDPAVKDITEFGFSKCREIFLDSIARMVRTTKPAKGSDTYQYDNTSEAHGVSPGRHLAADALIRKEIRGITNPIGQAIERKLLSTYGDAYHGADVDEIHDEQTNSSPAVETLGMFYPNAYPDKKYSGKKFDGFVCVEPLKCEEDWT